MEMKEKFRGCVIGQCLGDALGLPVEGYPSEICKRYIKQVIKERQIPLQIRGNYEFGQYSDDSQLARELILSILEKEGFDPCDYASRIATIFKEDKIVGRGRATEEAAIRLIKGVPWNEAGTPPPSAGNGSAMRVAPIGLFFHDDPEGLIKAAHDQGIITHKDKRCSAGSVAVAGAVALALTSKRIDVYEFLHQLSKWTEGIDSTFSIYLLNLSEWINLSPSHAFEKVSTTGMDPSFYFDFQGITPFVISSVLWSLYAFLKTPDDYMRTISTAIEVGGDVDTTSAMAGAISGAYLGLQAIPMDLASRLTDQGTWGYDDLLRLADRLYELKHKS